MTNVEKVIFVDGSLLSSTPPNPISDADTATNQISENTTNGATVGITAYTADPDLGDSVTYNLTDNAGGRFAIDATTGIVTVANAALIDYETNTSHNITIEAIDTTGQFVTQTYTITVLDGDDVPTVPMDSNSGANTVAENAANGTLVGITASSTDPNAGDTVTYSLTNDAGGRFTIDPVTGIVTVANGTLLDYETNTSHSITAQASDGMLATQQTFTITVTNVQDNPTWTGTTGNDTFTATDADNWTLSGLDGNDIMTGSTGNDTLNGGAGNDTHNGGAGSNQFLFSGTGEGFDVITGGAGTDTIAAASDNTIIGLRSFGGVEAITANGYAGVSISGDTTANTFNLAAVTLTGITRIGGGDGNDVITGTAGNDTIAGDGGNDTLNGGSGDDVFLVSGTGDGFDAITGGVGTDVIQAMADNTTIGLSSMVTIETITSNGYAGVTITGDANANTLDFSLINLAGITQIQGGAGNDTITGSGSNDVIAGNAGNDAINGGAGDDQFLFTGTGDGSDALTGGTGTDTVKAMANGTVIGLSSINGIETFTANGYANVSILGSALADTLDFSVTTLSGITGIDGGAGNDTIKGSAGDDVFTFSGTGEGYDSITGNGGTDTIQALANGTMIGLTALASVEAITANGYAGVTIAGSTGNETLDFSAVALTGIAAIDGGAGNDVITGSSGADTIIGNAGNDTLNGGTGDDTFQISGTTQGTDAINGGTGNDQIVAMTAGTVIGLSALSGVETITANGLAGVSILASTVADTLDFSTVTLTGITLIDAGAGNDIIIGSAGNDVIVGNAGDDVLSGGAGDDVFQVTGAAQGFDNVNGGAGNDQVVAMANGTAIGLSVIGGVETVSANGYTGVNIQGSTLADTLNFSVVTLVNIGKIDGGAGNDTITGSVANDLIVGNTGDDVLDGGAGDDTFQISGTTQGFDNVTGGTGNDLIAAMANGTAIGLSGLNGVETITANGFTGVSIQGSAVADTLDFSDVTLTGIDHIDGGAGNDAITGSAGNDLMAGGAGADLLNGGGGVNTVSYSLSATAVTVNLTAATQTGGDAQGDQLSNFSNVTGSAFNDTLTGDTNDNVLTGGAGNDTLNGGLGNDTLDGGAGTDTANYADSALAVSANLNTGVLGGGAAGDTLIAIENLTGSAYDDSLTGNSGVNVLTGGAGNDVLDGGAGSDTMIGGAGNDTYYVGSASDVVTENAGEGTDQINAAIASYTLGTNVENLSFIGTGNFTGTGNSLTNVIVGGSGADTLNGGAGQDSLAGGVGADVFKFLAASDTAVGLGDFITDFSLSDGDKIDVSAIDANTTIAGDQAFTFVGSAAFSGAKGELRAVVQGDGNTHVFGSVAGTTPNFEVVPTGSYTLAASNFTL